MSSGSSMQDIGGLLRRQSEQRVNVRILRKLAEQGRRLARVDRAKLFSHALVLAGGHELG